MTTNSLRLMGLAIVPFVYSKNKDLAVRSRSQAASQKNGWNSNWDGLEGDKFVINKKRTLILVRHGQYEMADNDKGRILTELGRKQAEKTGLRLATLLSEKAALPPLNEVVYSTMTRATETHNIIYQQLKSSSFSDSVSNSDTSMLAYQSKPSDLIREGAVCRPEPDTWRGPAEEDYTQDNARVEKAFKKFFHRSVASTHENNEGGSTCESGGSTLLVCHGNVIRYFTMRALQLPQEAWLRTSVANASITIITIHPSGGVSLQCMGDTGHLAPAEITFN